MENLPLTSFVFKYLCSLCSVILLFPGSLRVLRHVTVPSEFFKFISILFLLVAVSFVLGNHHLLYR